MSIETPLARPDLLKKIETDFGSSIAKQIWRKVMFWQLWTNRSIPVGTIISFWDSMSYANGDPLASPKANFWQWCDGAAISNANSPLNGQNTPNLKEKFLKGSSTIALLGGQSTINLQHNHDAYTSYEHQVNGHGGDQGGDADQGFFHRHGIANSWDTTENVIPPYTEVQYYMRVDGGANQQGPALTTNLGELVDTELTDFANIMSQELATTLYNNNSWLNVLIPVGMVMPIMTNIPGVANPDPNIWQECDGSEITNENSPLRSIGASNYYTPNLIDRYIRIPSTFGLVGGSGGVNQYDFTHNHTGFTDYFESPAGMDHGHGHNRSVDRHRHQVNTDMALTNIEPPFFTVKFFMRIN